MAILFFAIGVLSFLYSYVGWKLLVPLGLGQPWNVMVWIILFIIAMLPLLSILLRFNRIETDANDVIAWLGYISLGFVSLLFFFLLLKDALWVASMAVAKIASFFQGEAAQHNTILSASGEERRQLLWSTLNMAILGVSGVMTCIGYIQAKHRMKTIRVTIPIKDLPEDLEGLRIVQISDIHVGPTIKRKFTEEVVQRVNLLNPDIVALTGDLVDGSVEHLADDVEPLKNLSAKYGKFFVTGNHEYYSGVYSWIEKVKELDFEVLLNQHKVLKPNQSELVMGGITDISARQMVPSHRSDPVASLAGAPPNTVKILLAHQPVSAYQAAKAGYDIQLSGHTHGGQYFPFSRLVKWQQPFLAGLYKHENTWVYVNRGTGYWGPPMRLGPPAEITEVILSGRITDPIEETV